jgi:hypothetical protein
MLPIEVDGRYPCDYPRALKPDNIRVTFQSMPFATIVRLDDVANSDFWMELRLTRSDLQALLERMR